MSGDSVVSSDTILSTSSIDSQANVAMRTLVNSRAKSIEDQQKQQVKTGDVLIHYNGDKKISLTDLARKVRKNSNDLDLTVKTLNLMIRKIINCVRQELKRGGNV